MRSLGGPRPGKRSPCIPDSLSLVREVIRPVDAEYTRQRAHLCSGSTKALVHISPVNLNIYTGFVRHVAMEAAQCNGQSAHFVGRLDKLYATVKPFLPKPCPVRSTHLDRLQESTHGYAAEGGSRGN